MKKIEKSMKKYKKIENEGKSRENTKSKKSRYTLIQPIKMEK